MSIIPGTGTQADESWKPLPAFDDRAKEAASRRWRLYGLTPERFGEMYRSQGGRCAICHEERKLNVDHDHATGKVRALLCSRCNWVIGVLGDEPELAELIADYLESHA